MTTTLFVPIVIAVAFAVGWLTTRQPVTRGQVFSAAVALAASLSILARPVMGVWWYIAALIAATMATSLLIAGLRRWRVTG